MNLGASWPGYAVAIVAGGALWFATSVVSGRAEPWDAPQFWTVAYPLAIALAGVLGFAFPRRPWRWAVAIMLMQAAVMLLRGAGPGLLPLGIVLLGVLSLPGAIVAGIAARLRSGSDLSGA